MLLSAAIEEFHLASIGVRSRSTWCWYKGKFTALVDFLGDVEIKQVTIRDLRRWRASLVERETRWGNHPYRPEENHGLSVYTLHAYVRAIKCLFNWLEDEEILDRNPARRLSLPPLPKDAPVKDISHEDAVRIINSARDNTRDFAMLLFMAESGCRAGGLVPSKDYPEGGLRLADLKLPPIEGRYRATVREKGRGGQRKSRTVYFGHVTNKAIKAYLSIRPDIDDDRVFLTLLAEYRPLMYTGLYQMIERYAKRLSITGRWNPHAWRHAFALGILDNGGDLKLLSQLMGHSTVQVTGDIYGNRANKVLAEHHGRYSWLPELDEEDEDEDEDVD